MAVAFGVVLASRPDVGALTLATVFGLLSIVYGITTLTLAAQTRRLRNGHPAADPGRGLTQRCGRLPDQVRTPAAPRL